jgi:hypothetical protein
MIKEDDFSKVTTIDFVESISPKGYIIAKVSIDEKYFISIWCDRITVFGTKPPSYCLYKGVGPSVCGMSAARITVAKSIQERLHISDEFLKALNSPRISRHELERVGMRRDIAI